MRRDACAELQATFRLITAHPQSGRRLEQGLRRIALPTYPYLVFYRIDDDADAVDIITIRHGARSPETGSE